MCLHFRRGNSPFTAKYLPLAVIPCVCLDWVAARPVRPGSPAPCSTWAAARGRPGGKARPRQVVPPHRRTRAQLAPPALRQGARFLCALSTLACESPRDAPGRRLGVRVAWGSGRSRANRAFGALACGVSHWSQGRLTHRARLKLVPGAVFICRIMRLIGARLLSSRLLGRRI